MLRIAVWMLRSSCSARLGKWRRGGERVYYFAYGANVHPKVMQRRGIHVYAEEAMALEGYRLSFSQAGPWKNCGFGSVDEDPAGVVWGKLYLISRSDARRLEYEELAVVFRRHRKIELRRAGRQFFFFQAVHPRPGLKPTAVYLGFIVGGLDGYPGVPREYVAALQRLETTKAGAISDSSGYLVRDMTAFPRTLHPVLKGYERLGAWMLSKL